MSCVRAAPTVVPAMRPAMQNTVTAVGSTSVSKHGTGQLSHSTPPFLLSTIIPHTFSLALAPKTYTLHCNSHHQYPLSCHTF